MINKLKLFFTSLIVLTISAMTLFVEGAEAQMVSVTFDDGFKSTYESALPVLSARNIPATIYVSSDLIGGSYDGQPMMTWAEVESLQNTYGWEIGGHTANHLELPILTTDQIIAELTSSNALYVQHGLVVSNFATPYGAYDNNVLTEVLKLYASHRGFADRDFLNTFPYNKTVLQVKSVEFGVTPAMVTAWIDQAKANNEWLILVFHMVGPVSQSYEYRVSVANFTTMADYIISSGIEVKRVSDALVKPGVNIVANSNFATGISDWTTSSSTEVTLDTNNNGAYGDSTNSVKMTGSGSSSYLFSDFINIDPSHDFTFESFYNATGVTSGELGYYIDEYDTAGNWISGKWLGKVVTGAIDGAVGYFSRLYHATSALVSKVGLQVYLTANSIGSAFVDNIDLHDLNASGPAPTISITPTPSPEVTPTITPIPSVTPTPIPVTNLIQNPSFEDGFINWTTDNSNYVTVDTLGNGSNPLPFNSIKFISGSGKNIHLFSDRFAVVFGHQYDLTVHTNALSLTAGEIGYYIDEYDVLGGWISGRWLGFATLAKDADFVRVYTPTSANVVQASVQTYLTSASQGTVYTDNYVFNDLITPTPVVSVTPTATPTITPTPEVSITPTPIETVTPTPTVMPTITPTPLPVANLVNNPSFENVNTGWALNWIRQTADFVIDSTFAHDGTNSVKLTGTTGTHLFSDRISVDPAKTYVWSQYIKAVTVGAEFGYYIDEYDVSGNWISGQWKGAILMPIDTKININYVPSSNSVVGVGLQYYHTGGGVDSLIYIDDVNFATN